MANAVKNFGLSKFFHCLRVSSNTYAIYNSLLMEVLYVDEPTLYDIFNCTLSNEKYIDLLFDSGIYVKDNADEVALSYLKEICDGMSGKIDIMYLIVTQNCNLNCSYCFLHNNPNRNFSYPAMDYSIAKAAIDKFCNYIEENNIEKPTIIFYGGEPLINKDVIINSVNYANSLRDDFVFSIITNGTLLDDDMADFCHNNAITVGLSLDGPKELHNKNRKYYLSGKPSFDDCIKAKGLLEKHKCSYGLSMVLSKDIITHKKEVFEWLFKNHNGEIFFNLLHFNKHDKGASDYIKEASKFMIEFYEECEKRDFPIREGRIERQIDSFREQRFSFSDCGAVGCHQITVVPDGQICICHGDSVNSSHFLGNIKEIDLSFLSTNSSALSWSSLSTLSDDECLNCPYIFICGRGCPHHAGNLFGSRDLKDKNYCYYAGAIMNWLLKRGYTNQTFERRI